MFANTALKDPNVIEKSETDIDRVVDVLKTRRRAGEFASESMRKDIKNLEQDLKNPYVSKHHQFIGYFSLALQDPHNKNFAKEFIKRITPETPTETLTIAYALGRKSTYEKLGYYPDSRKDEYDSCLLEASPAEQVPLHRMMDQTIQHIFAEGFYNQPKVSRFIGDLLVVSAQHYVPINEKKIEQFEHINNQTQFKNHSLITSLFGQSASAISCIYQCDNWFGFKETIQAVFGGNDLTTVGKNQSTFAPPILG